MIDVLGRATSLNVQIVMWAIAELGLECKRHDFGGAFGGNDTTEYLEKNPNGLVPVLIDGDLTLFESAAIVRYLGAQYGNSEFYPSDARARAELDKWAEWIKTTFSPLLLQNFFYPLVRDNPAELDEAALSEASKEMARVATMLDDALGEGPFLGGDAICFADIVIGSMLYRYFTIEFERAELPNLSAYYKRLKERPSYVEYVMVSYEPLRWKER